ncbi:MAG TPA: hypothetical protein VNL77_23310 [Roseiflexaceae bacterium]|nr:hypothetical protein [Roseiflexaceae bacterium]
MSDNPTTPAPYIPRNPGDLVTAEDWNDMQVAVRTDLAANAAADAQRDEELRQLIANVDAPKFGGKTPDEWTDELDQRYIRRDDPGAMGEYRRYFKQLNRQVIDERTNQQIFEPCVIEHKLCRYPLVEVYELLPVFAHVPQTDGRGGVPAGYENVKFLIYYASKRDPMADLLTTESSDRYYWGDDFKLLLSQFDLKPALTQKLDDVVNDIFGKMFDPGLGQDQFDRDTYNVSEYVQKRMIDTDQTVGDLMKGGQWNDLRVAIRPVQIPALSTFPTGANAPRTVQVFHISQNEVEIRVPTATDIMVILRT